MPIKVFPKSTIFGVYGMLKKSWLNECQLNEIFIRTKDGSWQFAVIFHYIYENRNLYVFLSFQENLLILLFLL